MWPHLARISLSLSLSPTMATTTEKVNPTEMASIDKGTPSGNLTLLAQAAATERALTPLQAIRIYWRAFFWCTFMCIGALLWGYDAQVRLPTFDITHLTYPLGRRRLVEHPPVPHRLWLHVGRPTCPPCKVAKRVQQRELHRRHVWWSFAGLDLGLVGVRVFPWLNFVRSLARGRRRGAVALACFISIVGVLIQFLSPKHANGMLLVGKLINGYALGSPIDCGPASLDCSLILFQGCMYHVPAVIVPRFLRWLCEVSRPLL